MDWLLVINTLDINDNARYILEHSDCLGCFPSQISEVIGREYVTGILNPEGRIDIETKVPHKFLISDFTKM
jgi:hypothetical protein